MSTQAAPLARPLGSPLRTYPLGTGVVTPTTLILPTRMIGPNTLFVRMPT